MTTSRTSVGPRRPAGGFSLTELIIGVSISTFILTGVLSAFLLLGRSGMNAANYAVAEAEVRRGVEELSQDVRMASNVTWNSNSSVTLTLVPSNAYSGLTGAHANRVTYAYDATKGEFYRLPGTPTSSATRLVLVRGVSEFYYERFNRAGTAVSTSSTNPDAETKMLRLFMNVRQSRATLVDTNTTLVLASYVLRNKPAN